jgi:hypothetical protein
MNGTTNIPGRTFGAMNVVQVMSLMARERGGFTVTFKRG